MAADITGTSDGGSATSSSNNKIPNKISEICNEIVHRWKKSGNLEANSDDFHRDLLRHFVRFPNRYSLNVNNKFDDIIMHKRLLELAKYAKQLPVIDVRLVQANEENFENKEIHEKMQPETQITVVSDSRPMLFKEVIDAFAAMNLDFKDVHAYQTSDGYSLGVFTLLGCKSQAEGLKQALQKELCNFDATKATVLQQQHHVIAIGLHEEIGCSWWSWWTSLEMIIFAVLGLVASYCLVSGVALLCEAGSMEPFYRYAAIAGKRVIGEGQGGDIGDKDIGVALVFVIVPLLGIASVVLLLVEAIAKLILVKPAVAIITWLLIGLTLGGVLPFVKVKIAQTKNKAMEMFTALVTLAVTLTNFHRRKYP